MRVLVIHPEPVWFAGAEKVLEHFAGGMIAAGVGVTVALTRGSRMDMELDERVPRIRLEGNRRFSALNVWRQARLLEESHRRTQFDLVHGWAARDWELAALTGWRVGTPALGTLHDHPRAGFHSWQRALLMRLAARRLDRVICVSEAVKRACAEAGYAAERLVTVHNGLPEQKPVRAPRGEGPLRLGFLGVFVQRKGLRELFEILEALDRQTPDPWEIWIGGSAQDDEGAKLVEALRRAYQNRRWWPRVRWRGWVKPGDFLQEIDLLICPSAEFDPLPTVLLEAGQAGVPVVGWRVGGVAEVVRDGETGWTFPVGAVEETAGLIGRLIAEPGRSTAAGKRAREWIEEEFSLGKMVARYREVYSTALPYV